MGKMNLKNFLVCFPRGYRIAACQLLTLLVAVGCRADLGEPLQSGRVFALHGLQGRWVGPVVPIDRACGPTTQGLMSIGQNGFGLDPFQSTTVIHGEVGDDGHLTGKLVRQGAEHQDISIAFEGNATGSGEINGTLQSGRCHWTVTLHRG